MKKRELATFVALLLFAVSCGESDVLPPDSGYELKVLTFEDVDGQENAGEFQNVTIEVPVFKVKDGDGNWYDGAYEAGANVTMIKK